MHFDWFRIKSRLRQFEARRAVRLPAQLTGKYPHLREALGAEAFDELAEMVEEIGMGPAMTLLEGLERDQPIN